MKIAIITGASSGMGRELAIRLANDNPVDEKFDEMWLIARNETELRKTSESVNIPCKIIPLDLTQEESLEQFRSMLKEADPTVGILVNCSGYGKFKSTMDTELKDIDGMIDLNCKALVHTTVAVLPYMRRGSHILQLDSLSAFQPVPYLNVYAATKAFVLSFSRALAAEIRHLGIKVLAVCPGWVSTAFFKRAEHDENSEINYFNKVFTPGFVASKAIKCMYRGNCDVYVPGLSVKLQVLAVKLLPHRLVMNIWLKQQGMSKNKKVRSKSV